ncbi:pimeloyl-ACP methyl ester carboxylesterase [Aneurinibacillus soli]|uniref:3-oxoadipate enol-lactonase 2 n=1 Tax=Aneurinibacillus soli TaxID=1500254 RepID=A0A0U4WNG1_9BACL|nr:alpha/beta hydrolase [Aneurinibacillus soli]PYE61937.1 pimeloyl-ACP methyl ester carboxylesterase [Aneurinibacillus soli]BAU29753.1 3-oxoadipate enol-lactonase 2 [Aneurinibacillus soli]
MKQTVQTNGISLAYHEEGQGEAVVFLHGFCGSSAYWERIVPELSRTFRVITPDLRGHGASAVSTGTYSMDLLADDIAGLLKALNLEQAYVFGHSLGGYVTLALADNHPELVKGFGLIHSTGMPDDKKAKEIRQEDAARIEEEGIEPFINELIPKLFTPKNQEEMKNVVEHTRQIGLATPPKGAINTLKGMAVRPDRTTFLTKAKCPVLLVTGEDDHVIPSENTWTGAPEHAVRETYSHCVHMSMYEAPDKLIHTIQNFVK